MLFVFCVQLSLCLICPVYRTLLYLIPKQDKAKFQLFKDFWDLFFLQGGATCGRLVACTGSMTSVSYHVGIIGRT